MATIKEYVEGLGYGNPDRHVYEFIGCDDDDYIPEVCHILAAWPNGAVTAHFNVPNTVLGFFQSLDEAGDPAKVSKIWCCDADHEDEVHLDTDDSYTVEWPPKN